VRLVHRRLPVVDAGVSRPTDLARRDSAAPGCVGVQPGKVQLGDGRRYAFGRPRYRDASGQKREYPVRIKTIVPAGISRSIVPTR